MCEKKEGVGNVLDEESFPDDLTLQWMYFEALGHEMVGTKGEPFAVKTLQKTVLFIDSADQPMEAINTINDCPENVFDAIQQSKAAFRVDEQGKVICKIGALEAKGPDYIRAGMAAFTKLNTWRRTQAKNLSR